MNCAQANRIDLVELLASFGYHPEKFRGVDYWYLSPLRHEVEASFKINRGKNIWYDHGAGKGGKTIDFVMQYFNCNVSEALHKISHFHQQDLTKIALAKANNCAKIIREKKLENSIKILAEKEFISDPALCLYIEKRKINTDIANAFLQGN